jgi:hypothetical protein
MRATIVHDVSLADRHLDLVSAPGYKRRHRLLAATALGVVLAGCGGVAGAFATPVLSLSSGTLGFGAILVGHSATGQTDSVTNNGTPSQSFTIGAGSAPFAGSSKTATIGKNGSLTSNVYTFSPTVASGGSQTYTQTVSVTDTTTPANSTSFTLTGQAVAPIGSVSETDAGYVYIQAGHTGVASVTVQDTGDGSLAPGADSTSNAKYLHVTSVGDASGAFSGGGSSTGFTLTDSQSQPSNYPQSRTFSYGFAPTTTGPQSASISYAFSDGSANGMNQPVSSSITIHGTGVAPLASVSGGNAGDVLIGQSGSAQVTVTNNGNGNLDASLPTSVTNLNGSIAALSTGEFSGAGGSFSLSGNGTAPPGSQTFTYTFSPTIRGTESQNVGVSLLNGLNNQNASGTINAAVQGQGVAPVQSVSVTGAGNVRIGTSGQAAVEVSNIGDGNLSGLGDVSNLHGAVSGPQGAGASLFSGSGGSVDLPDATSAPGNTSRSIAYTYSPTGHVQNTSSVTLNFTNGNSNNTNTGQMVTATLTGQGVGPIYSSVAAPEDTIDFGNVVSGHTATENLLISNISTDPGDITLTGLTLLKGTISGTDGSYFGLEPGVIGTLLSEGDSESLAIDFSALQTGLYTASLTVLTDQDAAFGSPGDSFTYQLTARVVPEPSSLAVFGIAAPAFGILRGRRRRKDEV